MVMRLERVGRGSVSECVCVDGWVVSERERQGAAAPAWVTQPTVAAGLEGWMERCWTRGKIEKRKKEG